MSAAVPPATSVQPYTVESTTDTAAAVVVGPGIVPPGAYMDWRSAYALAERLNVAHQHGEASARKRIVTPCPSCGRTILFIGSGGHLTCSCSGCKEPGVAHAVEALHGRVADLERLVELKNAALRVHLSGLRYLQDLLKAWSLR